MKDTDHPILERPYEYEIVGLEYKRQDDHSATILLSLKKGEKLKRFLFSGVENLVITPGFPSSSGLSILDISARQLDGLRVEVANFENSSGCPTFMAQDVAEIAG